MCLACQTGWWGGCLKQAASRKSTGLKSFLPRAYAGLYTSSSAGALLSWLKLRRSDPSPDGSAPKEATRSPTPALHHAPSATTADLEGQATPRFRQPITPRRSALKKHPSLGGLGGHHGPISLNAVAHTGFSFPVPPTGPQLVPGVHLMPRAPSIANTSGLRPNVARTMATVQSMREAQANQRVQQELAQHAERERAQQAAEQAAMRDYLRSRPPQVCLHSGMHRAAPLDV